MGANLYFKQCEHIHSIKGLPHETRGSLQRKFLDVEDVEALSINKVEKLEAPSVVKVDCKCPKKKSWW